MYPSGRGDSAVVRAAMHADRAPGAARCHISLPDILVDNELDMLLVHAARSWLPERRVPILKVSVVSRPRLTTPVCQPACTTWK